MDEKTFELTTSYQLEESELGCSIAYLNFTGDPNPHLVVGTTYYTDKESEPSRGRILVFGVTDHKVLISVFSLDFFLFYSSSLSSSSLKLKSK